MWSSVRVLALAVVLRSRLATRDFHRSTFCGSCAPVQTDSQSLSQLIDKLTDDLPRSNSVRCTAKRARAGKLTAKFYTDGWPDFTTVVGHILSPAVSDEGEVIAFSTCKEKLLQVIQESGVVSWSKEGWQMFDGFEVSYANYLLENMKPPPGRENLKLEYLYGGTRYYFPGKLEGPARACPEGFFQGRLKPQHAAFVTSYWPYSILADRPNTQRYFESVIRDFPNAAVFQNSDPEKPVSWVMQYPYGPLAHGYTLEEFRGMGLNSLNRREVCRCVAEEGHIPETVAENYNSVIIHMNKIMGFIRMHEEKTLSIGLTG